MKPAELHKKLVEILGTFCCQVPDMRLGDPEIVEKPNFDELLSTLRTYPTRDGLIHQSGVYIIGDNNDVIRVGEGGRSNRNVGGGTMGHRVFRHIDKEPWMKDSNTVIFQPIQPAILSKWAESMALFLYWSLHKRLPRGNKKWG